MALEREPLASVADIVRCDGRMVRDLLHHEVRLPTAVDIRPVAVEESESTVRQFLQRNYNCILRTLREQGLEAWHDTAVSQRANLGNG